MPGTEGGQEIEPGPPEWPRPAKSQSSIIWCTSQHRALLGLFLLK